jgi:hypothetical protein
VLQHYSSIPLEYETFTMALIRIACRQVERDYRQQPAAYASHPPTAILALAEAQRAMLPSITTFAHLVYIAKAVQNGYKLREIPAHNPKAVWRAIHKRAVGDRRKQLPPY